MVNLLWKFHRLPCTSSNRRPAACEVVGGIQYTYAQPAQRTRQQAKSSISSAIWAAAVGSAELPAWVDTAISPMVSHRRTRHAPKGV